MDCLQIERIGGVAGFGGPHLKARGELPLSSLSPADRRTVDGLFDAREKPSPPAPPGEADAFRYRITRQTRSGPQIVEAPSHSLPPAVRNAVRDVLE
jgi:hypothetical protein